MEVAVADQLELLDCNGLLNSLEALLEYSHLLCINSEAPLRIDETMPSTFSGGSSTGTALSILGVTPSIAL